MSRPSKLSSAARTVWNAAINRRPALIARPFDAFDVVAAIRFAVKKDVPISIRGGGHSAAGLAIADDALVIDMSGMQAIQLTRTQTAVAQPGLVWREFDAATQALGLATTGGAVSSTGIAGLTLGWLDRLYTARLPTICSSLRS